MIVTWRRGLAPLVLAVAILMPGSAGAQATTCTFNTGPDVIVGDITGPANYSANGAYEALSLGTTSCNIGNTVLLWIAGNNQHPAISGNLYRYQQDALGYWRFEQVGMSWLKHGFTALQGQVCCTNCTPHPNGTRLGVGCSDPYTAGRNGDQAGLGPRWQVNADTGVFTYPPANPSWSGSAARRLQVLTTDLFSTATTNTRYFGECHYMSPDDASAGNNNNNASYRELTVTGSGSAWSFAFANTTQRQSSGIRAWKKVDSTVQMLDIQLPSEGLLILAEKPTDIGGGQWHYEFALHNMNSDDSIGSFSVPIPTGVVLTNIGFHDVAYLNGDGIGSVNQDGTDWVVDTSGGAITWSTTPFGSNPNANALRWGATYNFRFDANSGPQDADITLGRFKSGGTHVVNGFKGPSPVGEPGVAYCTDTDGASALCPCGNGGLPGHGCDNAHATGGVRLSVTNFAPDGFGGGTATILGTNFPVASSPTTLVIRSTGHESPPTPFGDGLLCVSSTNLVRFGSTFAISGTSTHPVNHGAGAGTFSYQVWYRSSPAFCTADQFNLSNGYDLTW